MKELVLVKKPWRRLLDFYPTWACMAVALFSALGLIPPAPPLVLTVLLFIALGMMFALFRQMIDNDTIVERKPE